MSIPRREQVPLTLAQVIAVGQKRVNLPVRLMLIGSGVLGYRLFGLTAWLIPWSFLAMTVAWCWWLVAVPRWWAWAINQGVDPDDLQDMAEAEKLVWSRNSWLYRHGGRFGRHDRMLLLQGDGE